MNVLSMKERLDRLRESLRTATDFQDPWNYFHDELALDPGFMRLGQPQASQRLKNIIGATGSRLLGREVQPQRFMLIYLRDRAFWHGTCGLGDHVVVCFHFEDVDQGLVGIMKSLTSGEVLLARLSLVELPQGVTSVARGGKA